MNKQKLIRLISLALILVMVWPATVASAARIQSNGSVPYYDAPNGTVLGYRVFSGESATGPSNGWYSYPYTYTTTSTQSVYDTVTGKWVETTVSEKKQGTQYVRASDVTDLDAQPTATGGATSSPTGTPTAAPTLPPSLDGNQDEEYAGTVRTYTVTGPSFWLYDKVEGSPVVSAAQNSVLTLTEVIDPSTGKSKKWYSTWYKNRTYYVPGSALDVAYNPSTPPSYTQGKTVTVYIAHGDKDVNGTETGTVQLYTDTALKNEATNVMLMVNSYYNVRYMGGNVLAYTIDGTTYYFSAERISTISDATLDDGDTAFVGQMTLEKDMRLYTRMDTGSTSVIAKAKESLPYSRASDDWYKVLYQGKEYYLQASLATEPNVSFGDQTAVSDEIIANTRVVTIGDKGAVVYTTPNAIAANEAGITLGAGVNVLAAAYNTNWYVYSIYEGNQPVLRYFQAKDTANANDTGDISSLRVYLLGDTEKYLSPSTSDSDGTLGSTGYYVVKSYDYTWYSLVLDGITYYVQKSATEDAKGTAPWYLTLYGKDTRLALFSENNLNEGEHVAELVGSASGRRYLITHYTGTKQDIYGTYNGLLIKWSHINEIKAVSEDLLQKEEIGETPVSGTVSGKTYTIVIGPDGADVYQDATCATPTGAHLSPGTKVQATQYTSMVYKVNAGYISAVAVASIVDGDDPEDGTTPPAQGGSVDDVYNGTADPEFGGEVLSYTVGAGGLWLYRTKNTGSTPAVSLKQGEKVSLTKEVEDGWYSIYYGGSIYYVSANDLKTSTESGSVSSSAHSIVLAQDVTVYAQQSNTSSVVSTIAKGTRVNVKVLSRSYNNQVLWYAYLDETGTKTIGYFEGLGTDGNSNVDDNSAWDALVSNGSNANFIYVIELTGGAATLYVSPDKSSSKIRVSKGTTLNGVVHDSQWYKVDYNGAGYYLFRSDVSGTVNQVTTGSGAASSTLRVTIGTNGATLYTYPSIPAGDPNKNVLWKDPDTKQNPYTLPGGTVVTASVYNTSWYTYAMNGQTYYFQNNVVADSNAVGSMTSYRFEIENGSIQLYSWPNGASSLGSGYKLTSATGNKGVHTARKTNASWWSIEFKGKTCYFMNSALQSLVDAGNAIMGENIATTTVGKTYKITIGTGGADVYRNILLDGTPSQKLPAGYQITGTKRVNTENVYVFEVQSGGTGYINANDVASVKGGDEMQESANAGQPNDSNVPTGSTLVVSLPAGTTVYTQAMVNDLFAYTLPEALSSISAYKKYSEWYEFTYNGTTYYFPSSLVETGSSGSGSGSGSGTNDVPKGTTVTYTLPAGTVVYEWASYEFGDTITLASAWTGKLTKAYSQWYTFTYTDGMLYHVPVTVVEGSGGGNINVDGSNTVELGDSKKFTVPANTTVYFFPEVEYGSFRLEAAFETTVTKEYSAWFSFLYDGQKVYIPATVVEGYTPDTGDDDDLPLDVGIGEKTQYKFASNTKAYSGKSTSGFYTTLQAGVTYTLTRVDPDWYSVTDTDGTIYFVPASSVTTGTGSTDDTQTSDPTTDGTGIITTMVLINPTTGSVNLRKEASLGSTILHRIPKGTQVRNLGYTKDANGQIWYNVSYDGRTGYVVGTYVAAVGTGSSTGGSTAFDPSQDIGKTLTVNTYSVNVRSGAGTSFSVLGKVDKGVSITPVEVKQDENGQYWYRFLYRVGTYGYIRSDYLEGSAINNVVQSGNVAIKAGGTNLRSGAGTMFGVRAKLDRNTIVTILGTGTDPDGVLWYRVTVNGLTGYVRHDLVRTLTASESDGLISNVIGSYTELRYGSKGDAVRALQVQLINTGYLAAGEADGNYGPKTMAAVQAFQRANGLTANGVATPATQAKLFNTPASSSGTTTKLEWFDYGYNLINQYPNVSIYDLNSGVTWNAKYINGRNHADVVPASQTDANKLVAYNITGDWHRRPVIVTINGSKFAGSMYAVGHGTTNYVSWFSGVMCIHFTGSMTHGSDKVDEDHQAAIDDALNSGL